MYVFYYKLLWYILGHHSVVACNQSERDLGNYYFKQKLSMNPRGDLYAITKFHYTPSVQCFPQDFVKR